MFACGSEAPVLLEDPESLADPALVKVESDPIFWALCNGTRDGRPRLRVVRPFIDERLELSIQRQIFSGGR